MSKVLAAESERAARSATIRFLEETHRDGHFAFGGKAWSDTHQELHRIALVTKPAGGSREMQDNLLDMSSPSFWHMCCYVLYRWTLSRCRVDYLADYFGASLYRGQAQSWPMLPSRWRLDEAQPAKDYNRHLADFFAKERPLTNGLEFFAAPDELRIAEAIGQHHGLPTNLIDFSFDPIVALHFAGCRSACEQNKGMGILFTNALNNMNTAKERPNPLMPRFELLPPSHAPRIYQQSGVFLDCDALDERSLLSSDHSSGQDMARNEKLSAIRDAASSELRLMCTTCSFERTYPEIEGFEEVFGEEAMAYWTGSATANRINPFFTKLTLDVGHKWYHAPEFVEVAVDEIKRTDQTQGDGCASSSLAERLNVATSNIPRPFPGPGESVFSRAFQYAEHLSLPLATIAQAAFIWGVDGTDVDSDVIDAFVLSNLRFFGACCYASENISIFSLSSFVESMEDVSPLAFAQARKSLTPKEIDCLRGLPTLRDGDEVRNEGDIVLRPEDI